MSAGNTSWTVSSIRRNNHLPVATVLSAPAVLVSSKVEGPNLPRNRKMDRLRRSFRDSFRKKKEVPVTTEAAKPHQWQSDEVSVRSGTSSFPVKYLGCVEVFESRGMQVCEEALKVLRNSRRRPVRGILYVSGDGLRVVDEDTKGLIVDQTIEKVSFCAPDRNHEKGFSYICRDGTTRRWMCHGFLAVKETGERLSHAVGCAFAVCLERKQKRDVDCGVTMSFDPTSSTFTRTGSFRQMTLTERLSDPQECKAVEPLPVKKVDNPHAISRPHATPLMLERQGSFRVFQQLNTQSPFKRQLSLRLNELPSNLERQRSHSIDNNAFNGINLLNNNQLPECESPQGPPRTMRSRLHSLPNAINMAPIPEVSPVPDQRGDAVSAMCQELSAGLSLLSSFSDPFPPTTSFAPICVGSSLPASAGATGPSGGLMSPVRAPSVEPILEEVLWNTHPSSGPSSLGSSVSRGEEWLAQIDSVPRQMNGRATPPPGSSKAILSPISRNPPLSQLRSASLGSAPAMATGGGAQRGPMFNGKSRPADPFDAEWASLAGSQNPNPNNPFLPTTVTKAFEVHM